MSYRKVLSFIALLILLLPTAAALAQDELPDEIIIERPGFLPEGIEWDADGERFLVGSLTEGTIYEVSDDGTSTAFIEDADLVSSVGIEIDHTNNRLLVANSDAGIFFDPENTGMAMLGSYDLETGERYFMVDLAALTPDGAYFANDVAVDAEGSAYVTNSFMPVIYKVDLDGNASVFIEDERLISGDFGLNGIVAHPDGYLIAAVAGAGALYKIPLDDPTAMSPVELDQPVWADGMVLRENGNLVAVSNGMVVEIQSDDDWASAQTVATVPEHEAATTAAVRGDEIYLIYAHLENPASEVYEIVRVDFGDM